MRTVWRHQPSFSRLNRDTAGIGLDASNSDLPDHASCWPRDRIQRVARGRVARGVTGRSVWHDAMIGLPAGTQIWVAAGATDMRKGFDALCAIVQETPDLRELKVPHHTYTNRPRSPNINVVTIAERRVLTGPNETNLLIVSQILAEDPDLPIFCPIGDCSVDCI